MSHYTTDGSQIFDIIQSLYCLQKAETHLLKALLEAAEDSSEIEANSVLQIIEEVGKTQQDEFKKIAAEFCENRNKALILAQVEKAGINITPGLKKLIKKSKPQNVEKAWMKYKQYYINRNPPVDYPTQLFYTILKNLNNENQGGAALA